MFSNRTTAAFGLAVVFCLLSISCRPEGHLFGGHVETNSAVSDTQTELSEELCQTVSGPALKTEFISKDGPTQVWIGSVRTKEDAYGRLLVPVEKAFLDVIAAAEGTSIVGRPSCGVHAGYEAIQSCYRKSQGLSYLSIEEIALGHPRRSVGGTKAAGRYQFLPATWSETGKFSEPPVYPLETFKPSAQDRAAILTIMRRRGEKVREAGNISPHRALLQLEELIVSSEHGFNERHRVLFEGIMSALAKEWASFPMASSNRSYYSSQSVQDPAELWKVFKQADRLYRSEDARQRIASAL